MTTRSARLFVALPDRWRVLDPSVPHELPGHAAEVDLAALLPTDAGDGVAAAMTVRLHGDGVPEAATGQRHELRWDGRQVERWTNHVVVDGAEFGAVKYIERHEVAVSITDFVVAIDEPLENYLPVLDALAGNVVVVADQGSGT